MSRKKQSFKIIVEFLLFLFVEKIILALPLSVASLLGIFLAKIVYLFDIRHRRRTISHIQHAGVASDENAAKALARKNFRHFGLAIVEIIKSPQVFKTEEEVRKRISISGSKSSEDLFFGRGKAVQVIAVTAHFGNWEIAGIGYCCLSGREMLSVMRDFDNPLIERAFVRRRQGFGHSLVSKDGAVKATIKAVKDGKSICFIADQHAGGRYGVEISFFGHPAKAHNSPAILHLITGLPILVGVSKRIAPMTYEFQLAEPIILKDKNRPAIDIVQEYSSKLESLISKAPEQWLWAHRRWLDINRKRT